MSRYKDAISVPLHDTGYDHLKMLKLTRHSPNRQSLTLVTSKSDSGERKTPAC